MLKIAICDDNMLFCSELEDNIIKFFYSENEYAEIDIYYTGENFIRHISDNFIYDIIFLDIELITTTGIEVGKYIRETLENDEVYIVYISGKTNYAMKLFQVRPVDFLLKPINNDQFKNLMHLLLRLINKGNTFFEYKVGHSFNRILLKEIIYFESDDKKIIIHQINSKTSSFYGKLNVIANQLKTKRFMYIHKSYLINYEHTIGFNYDMVTLSDNTILPISQSKRAEIRRTHLSFREG